MHDKTGQQQSISSANILIFRPRSPDVFMSINEMYGNKILSPQTALSNIRRNRLRIIILLTQDLSF